jgi:hypothetical protein
VVDGSKQGHKSFGRIYDDGVESPLLEIGVDIVSWLSLRSLGTVTVLGRV